MRYKRRGLISFGYDHTGHGEKPEASRSALVVCEQMGNWLTFPFVHRLGARRERLGDRARTWSRCGTTSGRTTRSATRTAWACSPR
jgi:hypothetical protein